MTDNREPTPKPQPSAVVPTKPTYENVSCSQCGASFGPGDHGFSHCDQHQKPEVWIPELIRNNYDKAPDHYSAHDNWDDGADDIARKIIERFKARAQPSTITIKQLTDCVAKAWATKGSLQRTLEETIEYQQTLAGRFICSGEAEAIASAILAAFPLQQPVGPGLSEEERMILDKCNKWIMGMHMDGDAGANDFTDLVTIVRRLLGEAAEGES